MDGVKSRYLAKTADPSTALLRSSGRDDKGEGWLLLGRWRFGWTELRVATPRRLQIPPLRSFGAPVGMTKGRVGYCSGDWRLGWTGLRVATPRRLQIPPLRSFRAPVGMTRGGLLTAREMAIWMDGFKSGYPAKTADPSAALLRSSGRDDKGRAGYFSGDWRFGWTGLRVATPRRLQIPPLRSFGAPVGMTRRGLVTAREIGDLDGRG
jgi:hypothetical protein